MGAYRDKRSGRWRYGKWVTLPDGRRDRITGTPATNTRKAAEHAEALHVLRVMSPGAAGEPDVESPPEEEQEVPTVNEYAATFMATYKPAQKPSERRAKQWILDARILPAFGARRLDAIRQEHIGVFVAAERERGCAAKTINNRLAVLSSLLKYAAENRVIAKPALRLTLDSMDAELVAVDKEDVDRLIAAAAPLLRVAVLLAAEAGLRAGEIRGLQWTDIRDGLVNVRRALDTDTDEVIAPKHNKARMVPLSDRLTAELKALPRRALWVLSQSDGQPLSHRGDLYKPMLELYGRAKVRRPPSPIHCLRHTFGTEMAAAGVPLPVLQELMGHASIETTRRYIHVNEEQKRAAVARVFGQQVGNRNAKAPRTGQVTGP